MAQISNPSASIRHGSSAAPQRDPLFVAEPPLASNGRPVIQKILIANRGEIACRIIQTCRKLNITSTSIYVNEDASSRHVQDADEAINIGSIEGESGNPFLNIDLLVQAAVSVGAQAIHPGYGYLSENADFANRVREAGLIFIGPSASAMSTLGDKRSSKDYLSEHSPDVPLIPGFAGSSQEVDSLKSAAEKIGFPVMLKASAGGGGKGMRIVREPGQLKDELERAQSEARRSFGSSDCILEKYIESSKHVEIQILGDSHGEVISFFDRDCSIQRRHQKVIEETPCPFLDAETREKISATAVRIAKLIGYENAGTVEFVLDIKTNKFYFLEVNARLQVEHPITEEVTGVDLVSLQIFAAAGGRLTSLSPLRNVSQHGHAIEVRLCAEDPQRNFFPEHGKVHLWLPGKESLAQGRDIRYETAVGTGASVSIYFDSMIAKILVWAPTRPLAIEKMVKVLSHTACIGVKTNQLFLQACLTNTAFSDPAYTTSFIPSQLETLLKYPSHVNLTDLVKVLSIIPSLVIRKLPCYRLGSKSQKPLRTVRTQFRNQRFDPVNIHCDVITPASSLNAGQTTSPKLMCIWKSQTTVDSSTQEEAFIFPIPELRTPSDSTSSAAAEVSAQYNAISQNLRNGNAVSSTPYAVSILDWRPIKQSQSDNDSWNTSTIEISVNGAKMQAYVVILSRHPYSLSGEIDRSQTIFCHLPALGTWIEFKRDTMLSYAEGLRSMAKSGSEIEQKTVTAPMPCKVLSVLKINGDEVKSGETVMVIESMKMEVSISVSSTGKFESKWKIGDAVEEGKILCSVV